MGDWVHIYLKLKPYRQLTMRSSRVWKLSPKYAGPFQVEERIGTLAYKLMLTSGSNIHPVFHVSLLKKHVDATVPISAGKLSPMDEDGQVMLHHVARLGRRMVKRNNASVGEVLVQWAHLQEYEGTWEDWNKLVQAFPYVEAWGQASK